MWRGICLPSRLNPKATLGRAQKLFGDSFSVPFADGRTASDKVILPTDREGMPAFSVLCGAPAWRKCCQYNVSCLKLVSSLQC